MRGGASASSSAASLALDGLQARDQLAEPQAGGADPISRRDRLASGTVQRRKGSDVYEGDAVVLGEANPDLLRVALPNAAVGAWLTHGRASTSLGWKRTPDRPAGQQWLADSRVSE